jgi:hypothetical protein
MAKSPKDRSVRAANPIRRRRVSRKALSRISASDIERINKLSTSATSSDDFAEAFIESPPVALAAKGIEITPEEASRIQADLERLGGSPGSVASTEVEVGIKVKKKF